jgi:hypothetical protein
MKHRLHYTDIAENHARVLAMTGLKADEFAQLSQRFEHFWQRRMQRITLENKPRERAYKVRTTSVFSQADDLLLFVLSYMKLNPLQEAHGATFGISQSKVCIWLGHCFPVLEEALASEKVLPARTNQELKKRLKDCRTVLIDATERPIQRSVDAETQREHYSGKKNSIRKNT